MLLGPSINNDQLSAFKSLYTYVRKSVTEVFESCVLDKMFIKLMGI